MSKRSIETGRRHGRTLEGSALATLTLTKEKDFNGLLPPFVALSLEHLVNVIIDFPRLLFGMESLFAVCGGLIRRWKEGDADGVRERAVSVCGNHMGKERGNRLEGHGRPTEGLVTWYVNYWVPLVPGEVPSTP